jgi:hypothetical protein
LAQYLDFPCLSDNGCWQEQFSNDAIGLNSAASSGQDGSFALGAYYTDPVSGISAVFVIEFVIIVNESDSGALPSIPVSAPPASSSASGISPASLTNSWALGAGLCDSSSTTACGGTHVSWSSEDGVRAYFTLPSWGDSNAYPNYITVNLQTQASNGSYYLMQYVAVAPLTSGYAWQLEMWILYPHARACAHNTSTVSAGTTENLDIYYYSPTGVWLAQDGSGNNYIYNSACSSFSGGAPGSHVASQAQEPFAFESYDGTSSDFSSFLMFAGWVFQYTSTGGNSWTNTAGAFVVDANNPSGGWPAYTIGGGTATLSSFVEAGSSQTCSGASTLQVYIGYDTQSPLSSTCGTNTQLTQLN